MAVPHQSQIWDVTYLNWVRAGLGLKYTKEGLESFIDNEARVFHSSLLNQLGQPPQNCGQCTVDTLLPHPQSSCQRRTNCICSRGPRNMRRLCPNNVCGTLFNAIVSNHRFNGPSLKNSNISQWVTDHWEVAKNFLPSIGGYTNKATAADTDLSGLVNIGINMLSITRRHNLTVSSVDGPDDFIKCRTARNQILHSSSQSLTDDELTGFLNDMKATLRCAAALLNDATAQQAVTKLTQLETSSFEITDENITEVRRMQLLAIQEEGRKQIEAIKEEGKKQKKYLVSSGIHAEKRALSNVVFEGDRKRKRIQSDAEVNRRFTVEYMQAEGISVGGEKQIEKLQQAATTKADARYQEMKNNLRYNLIETYIAQLQPATLPEVDRLYVEPSLKLVTDEARDNRDIETQWIERQEDITNITNVFFQNETQFHRIYISGDAGHGKTALCKMLVLAWCHEHSGKKINTYIPDEFLVAMKKFDFLFYIPLRNIRKDWMISEIIKKQYFEDPDFLNMFIKNECDKSSCLVILDGLDEWVTPSDCEAPMHTTHGLPDLSHFTKYTILTTTRPWKLEELRLGPLEMDRQIQLKGIDKRASDRYIENMVDLLNQKENVRKESHDFKQHIKAKDLEHFLNIPILLKLLILLWHYYEKEITGRSQVHLYSAMINHILKDAWRRSDWSYLSVGNTQASELPLCLKEKQYCKIHKNLFLSMAHLAFTSFKELLVFDHVEAKPLNLTEDDIKSCLAVGLLCQEIYASPFEDEKKKLSFLHNSFQNFLAAVYLVMNPLLAQLPQTCNTMRKILDVRSLFIFVSGMDSKIMTLLSDQIQNILKNDEEMIQFCSKPGWEGLEPMQDLLCECVRESKESGQPLINCPLESVNIVSEWKDTDWRWQYLPHLINLNLSRIKILHVYNDEEDPPKEFLTCLRLVLSGCQSVQHVRLVLFKKLPQDMEDLMIKAFRSWSLSSLKMSGEVERLPSEIQAMDKDAIKLYRKALQDGNERVFDIRLKLVGHEGVGKTSLAKRLLRKTVDPHERIPTDGIDVHIGHCRISLETGEWISSDEDCSLDTTKKRLLQAVSYGKSQAEDRPRRRKEMLSPIESEQHTDDKPSIELKNDFQETKESPAVRSNMEMEITQPDNTENVNNVLEPAKVTPKTGIDIPAAAANYRQNSISEANLKAYIETLGETTHLQDKENHAKVSIWDFAGQTVFYNTHQIFLSPKSIYLLVTNIQESLDSDIPIDQNDCMPLKKSKTKKVSDFLEFWLNSIRFFCNESDSVNDPPADSANDPPVILVATHADCLGKDKTIAEEKTDTYFENIRMLFMSKETGYHIVDDADIAVDNLIEDPNFEVLKKTIYEEAKKQKHWGEQRPTRWITLEKELFEQKHNGKKVISRSELEDMNEKLPMPLPKPEELELFLRFQNDIGNFLHFNDEELKDHVVLDPQWLVDAFKCIVTTGQQKTKKNRLLGSWKEFTTTGKLSRTLLDFVLKEDFKENLNIIVSFFERLGIIAKPADDADYFFAPCFLEEPPESIFTSTDSDRTTNRLCLSTDNEFLPEILFNRLLAACISKYKIFKEQLFCCCGEFKYDQKHTFTVFYMNNLIKIWVISHDPKKPSPNTEVCEGIRRVMVQHLMGLCKLKDERKIEMYIDCPRVGVKTQKCLHKVSILRKEEGVICENCPDGHHYIESEEALKHWFPQENTNQNKKEDPYQSKKDGTEISRREERQNPHTSQGCFIQLDGKKTVEPTKVTKLMVKWFDSVCQICWNGGTATGFRVGPCYIMTALHVVDMITKEAIEMVPQPSAKESIRSMRLANSDVYAVFDNEDEGYKSKERIKFYFKDIIHFEDRNTDSVVLELVPNKDGKEMPQPFEFFAVLKDSMTFKLVGHDDGHKTKASHNIYGKQDVSETDIQTLETICKDIGLTFEVGPYDILRNPDRHPFHSIFTKGASGAPGITEHREKIVVVTMLLRGYPDGFYHQNEPQWKKDHFREGGRIEQGANMDSICQKMLKTNQVLCNQIFQRRKILDV